MDRADQALYRSQQVARGFALPTRDAGNQAYRDALRGVLIGRKVDAGATVELIRSDAAVENIVGCEAV